MDNFERQLLPAYMMEYKADHLVPPQSVFNNNDILSQLSFADRSKIISYEDNRQKVNREYNRAFIQAGYAFSKEQLKEKDEIDVRKLGFKKNDDQILIPRFDIPGGKEAFANEYGWFSYIPSLTESSIRVNTRRYIYYKITDISVSDMHFTVYLHDYINFPGDFQSGVSGTVTFIFNELNHNAYIKRHDDVLQFSEMYRMIPYSDLKWGTEKQKLWETVMLRFADDTTDKMISEYGTDQFMELCKAFLSIISAINYQLTINKVSRPKKKGNNDSICKAITVKELQPKKIIRYVGGICISSEKPPRMPSAENITHYKVASWKRRGFIRTLKNGKQVYVRETPCYRHCLKQKDTLPQTVIKFKKPLS